MNPAAEDYLKMIYEMSGGNLSQPVKLSELAERFGYTVQSVNEMVRRIQDKGLLAFMPYKGVTLTDAGLKEAVRMIRVHRVWEVFLSEKLHLRWDELHEEAEQLEHATSPLVLEKLYTYLGEPKYCNHGNPIPNQLGEMAPRADGHLYDAPVGQRFMIQRVLDHKPLLAHLYERGLSLGDELIIIDKDTLNGLIHVKKADSIHVLGKSVATMIFGKKQT